MLACLLASLFACLLVCLILFRWGRDRAYFLTLVFLGTWLGYCNAHTTLNYTRFQGGKIVAWSDRFQVLELFYAVLAIVVRSNFQEGFGLNTDQMGKLNLNEGSKQRINCSRTEFGILPKETAYPNVSI